MKSTHRLLTLIIIGLILWQTAAPVKTFAWLDCPYGEINDPHPGLCELYIDTNNNRICDHSESAPQTNQTKALQARKQQKNTFLWFLFVPAAFYFFHWYLVNQTKLKKKNWFFSPKGFKYFWNLILLAAFIPAGIFGLLWGLGVKNQYILRFHNNLGVSFVVVAFLHLINHLNYYLKPLKQES